MELRFELTIRKLIMKIFRSRQGPSFDLLLDFGKTENLNSNKSEERISMMYETLAPILNTSWKIIKPRISMMYEAI